jgi:hypothetical protein
MLRDEALQPELASLAEKIGSYLALFKGIDEYPFRPPAYEPGEIGLRAEDDADRRSQAIELWRAPILAPSPAVGLT